MNETYMKDWHASANDKTFGVYTVDGSRICTVSTSFQKQREIAHLIAAAPDLYDVLDAWSKASWFAGVCAVKDSNDPVEALLYRTRAALARARGES